MPFRSIADVFAFSSLLAATIGFGLSIASSLAMGAPHLLHAALLASTGTFIIYNLDRLRDTERDSTPSPDRTAFVQRHRGQLTSAVAFVAVAFGGLLFAAPPRIAWVCVGIGLVGLVHRRIKKAAAIKTLYVSLAWTAACVGIPWINAGGPTEGAWVAAIITPILCVNLIASNLRDDETQILRSRPDMALRIAGGLLLGVLLLILVSPTGLAPLGWIVISEGIAIWQFRRSERYGLLVIDGALLVGSLAATLHFAILG